MRVADAVRPEARGRLRAGLFLGGGGEERVREVEPGRFGELERVCAGNGGRSIRRSEICVGSVNAALTTKYTYWVVCELCAEPDELAALEVPLA